MSLVRVSLMMLVLPLQCCCLLVLFVIVFRMTQFLAVFFKNLISVFSFSIISKLFFFFMYPLAVLSHVQPGVIHEISSVIRGMRGNKPDVSPQR